jgi:hypothetical protein
MGWVLVTIVGINVVMLGIYSMLNTSSDYEEHLYGDDQYHEN